MKGRTDILILALLACGCASDVVPDMGGCPEGFDLVDGECVERCDPPCGPGEVCRDGACVEASGDGDTDVDAPADGVGPDGPGDAVDAADTGGDPPLDGEDPPWDGVGDPPWDGADGSCEEPWMVCGGHCVNPLTDVRHCGGCDLACPAGAWCVSGTCECGVGEMVCDGVCIDVMGDPLNCGGCDVACGDNGPSCVAGACMCGADPACAPCDPTSCATCATCCPREGCIVMDENNCGSCGASCWPLDQCGAYDETGACDFVCEEAFDPTRHYNGMFDITPPVPSTTCSGTPSHNYDRLHFLVMGGNLEVRAMPYLLRQVPVPSTADFVVTGLSGCLTATLTGHFRNADVFNGTWEYTPLTGCPGCVATTIAIRGVRH